MNPYKQPVVTLKLWIRQQTVIAEGNIEDWIKYFRTI